MFNKMFRKTERVLVCLVYKITPRALLRNLYLGGAHKAQRDLTLPPLSNHQQKLLRMYAQNFADNADTSLRKQHDVLELVYTSVVLGMTKAVCLTTNLQPHAATMLVQCHYANKEKGYEQPRRTTL